MITSLGQGGAETVLFRVISATAGDFQHAVVSLSDEGYFAAPLRAMGVEVRALGMPRGRVNLQGWRQLRQVIRDFRPDVVQTRLHHANLLGALAARFTGHVPVVWAVHSGHLGTLRKTWKTRLVRKICAWLSHSVPVAIISDAQSSADLHVRIGFSRRKFSVIYNGVDGEVFRPDPAARARMRALWNVREEEVFAGCVARWDPLKDHENLLRALKLAAADGVPVRCALVGTGMTGDNSALAALIDTNGVRDQVLMVGASQDVPGVMAALDLLVMSSLSESMPVAVVEGMSCGVPCVVTDVGDSAAIVGDTGWVVPARDPRALATALGAAVAEAGGAAHEHRAAACRERIASCFSLDTMKAEYAQAWQRAASLRGPR